MVRVISGLGWFVAACLAVFGAPLTAAWCAALATVMWVRRRWLRRALVATGLVGALPFWSVPLHEYVDRVDALHQTIDRGGPTALTVRDRAGIWVLNLGMAVGGAAVGLPEVALETALLTVPGASERRFESCFAAADPRIRATMDRHVAGLPASAVEGQRVTFAAKRVAWRYDVANARVALALNPTHVGGTATFADGAWQVDHTMTVPVDYPDRSRIPLFAFEGRTLVLDEALFDALEDVGWLFPYTATWRCREVSRPAPRVGAR